MSGIAPVCCGEEGACITADAATICSSISWSLTREEDPVTLELLFPAQKTLPAEYCGLMLGERRFSFTHFTLMAANCPGACQRPKVNEAIFGILGLKILIFVFRIH